MAKEPEAGIPRTEPLQSVVVAGAKRSKMLDRMTQNPKGDWSISDVEALCKQVGLEFKAPRRGSHYKVFSNHLEGMLTIPAKKPIKPVYIRMLASLAAAHLRKAGEK